jgi:6-phosphogluconate dehydrogenase
MTLLFSEHGSRVGCFDTDKEAVQTVLKQAKEDKVVDEKLVHGFSSLDKLVEAFPTGASPPYTPLMSDGKKPRMLVLSLPHGKPADGILEEILPKLNKGDIIIDAGNEWWADTERRQAKAGEKGIKWVGMGVSGGCKSCVTSLWCMLNE